jgi:glutamine amidotransferase
MSETVIVDYGMANLRSVQKAFERVGHPAVISSDPARVGAAGKVVLPGVGAFRDAIARLREARLDEPILDHLRSGKPFLGICLGLQLLFTRSFEDGEYAGLDWLAGDVIQFPDVPGLKVPHMGWNQLCHRQPDCPLLRGVPDGAHVYFVHSYFARPADDGVLASTSDYADPFAAVVWRDNVFATQFHPEKSQAVGLTMLRNFVAL